ncbi:MAG: CHRD domain-containing protein [Candidatus Krumholzibacteriota bacterium]|nr:CHRD domain-containing protein [Candidatus Krumholzibacteriota bacterium]
MKRISAILLSLGILSGAGAAHSERTFVAVLDGVQNIRPCPEVTATGSAIFVLNNAETELTFHIEYSGLSSAEVDAHIHNAGARDEGPVVFCLPDGEPKDGVWMVTPTDVQKLVTKQLYVNIHTVNCNAGELRGNILEQTVPVRATTWGAVKALFSVR